MTDHFATSIAILNAKWAVGCRCGEIIHGYTDSDTQFAAWDAHRGDTLEAAAAEAMELTR